MPSILAPARSNGGRKHRSTVALVSTPLQLIALREYLASRSRPFSDCEVLAVPRRARVQQFRRVADHLGVDFSSLMLRSNWGLRGKFAPTVLEILRGLLLSRQMAGCRTLILGGYPGYAEHQILARIANECGAELVIVDDGTASVLLHERLKRTEPIVAYSGLSAFAANIAGIDGHLRGRVQLFSIFPLASMPGCEVSKNDLTVLRREMVTSAGKYQRLFIAEELGRRLSKQEERRYFDAVKRVTGEGGWHYLRHPAEPLQDAKRRASYLGMRFVEASLPFECWLAWEVGIPERVATVTSTGGFTACMLCPQGTVQFIRVDADVATLPEPDAELVYNMAERFGATLA